MLRLKDKIEASVTYADRAGSATMADVANAVAWDNVGGKPSTFPPSWHTHSKSDVGLGNVDNTADSAKSVATAGAVRSSGTLDAITGTNRYEFGLCFHAGYNNGYPTPYGNSITLTDGGCGELFCGWSGGNDSNNKTSMERLYYRNKRDVADTTWSDWSTVAFTSDIPTSFAWGNVTGKPSTFPPSDHSHSYLPLSGGTLSGDIAFSSISDTGTSAGLHWEGSTDGAGIYYQTTETDQGNLVLNLTDDDNCYLRIARNGTFTAYVTPNGAAYFSAVYNAVYNDYAEFFPRGEATEPGDIVALDLTADHESYIKATATSKIVAGVHSDEYAMLIGGDKVDDGNYVEKNLVNYIPVSLAGRVMCKVTGPVHRGDTIIVSDIPGVGIATDDENIPHKRVVGYVVEDDDQTDIRRIKIRVKG